MLQFFPEKPWGQVQLKSFTASVQRPPFWQGFSTQSLMSEIQRASESCTWLWSSDDMVERETEMHIYWLIQTLFTLGVPIINFLSLFYFGNQALKIITALNILWTGYVKNRLQIPVGAWQMIALVLMTTYLPPAPASISDNIEAHIVIKRFFYYGV